MTINKHILDGKRIVQSVGVDCLTEHMVRQRYQDDYIHLAIRSVMTVDMMNILPTRRRRPKNARNVEKALLE